ncbi:ATP synthase mitochondrial F1 complex assembly factor 1 isoform X3 [Pseudophryne corroboree]|uniref:ATP synthase mitochondrial F1 complex assembly factor 1 isoform X3 n=1 Tax=Pseudophryne corroboree TaxID=495146 RepID=UPI00308190D9
MWPASDGKMAAAVVQMCLGFRGVLAIRSRVGGAGALGLVSSQLRTFSVRKEPELEENPYYGKYRDKIQQLRRSDPGAFEARMEKQKEVKQQPLGTSRQAEYIRSVEEKVTSGSVKDGSTKNKMLNSLLNLELVTDKNAEDIKQIWNEYFSTKDTVYAVIPGEAFELIWRRAQSCPSGVHVCSYRLFRAIYDAPALSFGIQLICLSKEAGIYARARYMLGGRKSFDRLVQIRCRFIISHCCPVDPVDLGEIPLSMFLYALPRNEGYEFYVDSR